MINAKRKVPISVLIPTMNRPSTLKRTIESYMQGECIPCQIIVVDQSELNCVSNEVKQIVESYSEVIEVVYEHQKIPSSTKARNIAFSYAKEEIIIFSDDDVEIYPDTLDKINQKMFDGSISMIAGIDDNMQNSTGKVGYLLGTKSYKDRNKGHVTKSMLGRFPSAIRDRQVETMWAMGFFFVVRKSIIERHRLRWDEKLIGYAYAEDLDFSYSYYKLSIQENYRCIIEPSIHVNHMVSQEYRTPSKRNTYVYVINRWYLSYKHNMGISSRILIVWCDFWKVIMKIVKRDVPQDLIFASLYALSHRKQIKEGIFDYDFIS